MNNPKRVRINITLDPNTLVIVDKAASELNMTRSRFIEFMLSTMKNAQQLTIGAYINEVLKDLDIHKKKG